MKFISTPIEGVWVIEPRVFGDSRGSFAETFRADLFAERGILRPFVQDNHSSSVRGTLRGMHYQADPQSQAKLLRVVRGEIYDVVIDLRPGSPTRGRWFGETLSADNRRMMYVPRNFAHGFLVMSDHAEVIYKTDAYYAPALERGIAWNDPAVGIVWPDPGCPLVLSERDRSYPCSSV